MSSIPSNHRPAFVIGISGHMDIPEPHVPVIKERLRRLFKWLRECPTVIETNAAGTESWMPRLPDKKKKHGHAGKVGRPMPGLGLGDTQRIVLLTSMAPGADTLAAEVAREPEINIEVRCPLPFPRELYRQASTFTSTSDPKAALEKFDSLVNDTPASFDHFEVVLEEDRHLTADKRAEKMKQDVADSKRRRLRYRAAGEYVAANCHLLFALYTPDQSNDGAVGTGAIVRVRHEGPTLGLLPAANRFSWIDSGPVLHLLTRSKKRLTASGGSEQDTTWQEVPASYLPRPDKHGQQNDARIAESYERLRDIARLCSIYESATRDLNSDDSALKKHIEPELLKDDKLSPEGVAFLNELTPLASVRSAASTIAVHCDNARKKMMRKMAICAFFAAVFFHAFAHWHFIHKESHAAKDAASAPAEAYSSTAKATGDSSLPPSASPAAKEAPATTADAHSNKSLKGTEPYFSLLFLVLTLAAIIYATLKYCAYKRSNQEWLRFDARALAEGVRVQFYWAAAGLHASVAARYMFRQKGELDWIRNAINSLTLPYHQWKDRFEKLGPEDQQRILRRVLASWIGGQQNYFLNHGVPSNEVPLHRFHTLGWGLTWAGILQPVLLVIYLICKLVLGKGFHFPHLVIGGALLLAGLSVVIVRAFRHGNHAAEHGAGDGAHKWREKNRFLARLDRVLHFGVLPVILVASGLALLVVHFVPGIGALTPDFKDVWIILTGGLLVAGAILIAWGEKLSLSEHVRQYQAMGHLFANSFARGERLLNGSVSQDLPELQPVDRAEEFRQLLVDLGKEALHENAEWLLLHRSRPFEPFLAG